jgi:hypothetical protein
VNQAPESGWLSEVDSALKTIRETEKTVAALSDWLWRNVAADDVFPRELPVPLATLMSQLTHDLKAVEHSVSSAIERYRDTGLNLLLNGEMLSREQYHLLAAMGLPIVSANLAGLSDLDDYDIYRMFCYEDNTRYTLINPSEKPGQSGVVRLRFGCPPEELELRALRPEQLAFFRDRLPAVFKRFKS